MIFFALKIGTPVTPADRNIHTDFGISSLFRLRVRSPYGTDRRARHLLRPARTAA